MVTLPPPSVLGASFGLSELTLAIFKRSRGGREADQGSLRLVWWVILASVWLSIVVAARVHAADSAWLQRLYPFGVAVFACGLLLRWTAILWLGRFFTVNVAIAADHRLVDTGPYALVRHPSYTGLLVAFTGLAICWGNWAGGVVMLVPIVAVFLRRITIEEAALHAGLGEAYAAYARRTKRLIPFIY